MKIGTCFLILGVFFLVSCSNSPEALTGFTTYDEAGDIVCSSKDMKVYRSGFDLYMEENSSRLLFVEGKYYRWKEGSSYGTWTYLDGNAAAIQKLSSLKEKISTLDCISVENLNDSLFRLPDAVLLYGEYIAEKVV